MPVSCREGDSASTQLPPRLGLYKNGLAYNITTRTAVTARLDDGLDIWTLHTSTSTLGPLRVISFDQVDMGVVGRSFALKVGVFGDIFLG